MENFRETAKFIGVTDSRRKLVLAGHPDMPEATSPYALVNGVPINKLSEQRVFLTTAHMGVFKLIDAFPYHLREDVMQPYRLVLKFGEGVFVVDNSDII